MTERGGSVSIGPAAVMVCAATGETSNVIGRIERAMRHNEFMASPILSVIIE
jgi:hypothetical protein